MTKLARAVPVRVVMAGLGFAAIMIYLGMSAAKTNSATQANQITPAAGVAYARAQVAKYHKIPQFTLKAPAFNASAIKGKTIFNIPLFSADPFQADIDVHMADLAKSFGAKFIEWQNKGTPTEWAAGVEQAISQKADIINLQTGAAPDSIIPALQKAKAAGIPVTVTHLYPNQAIVPAAARPYVTAQVWAPFFPAARMEADWIIADSNGKANVLIVTSNDVTVSPYIVRAMQAEYKKYCPGCKVSVVNVPVSGWATQIKPAVESAITRDPTITHVNPLFDPMGIYATAAITAKGKAGKIKVVSYNGTPSVLRLLQTGTTYAMDVGEDTRWLAHADMDQIMRVLTGAPLVSEQHTALRILDATNIKQVGVPPRAGVGYGKAYLSGYKKLWSGK